MNEEQIAATKAGAIWSTVALSKVLGHVGINSWSDFAALCAAVYSILLICGWVRRAFRRKK